MVNNNQNQTSDANKKKGRRPDFAAKLDAAMWHDTVNVHGVPTDIVRLKWPGMDKTITFWPVKPKDPEETQGTHPIYLDPDDPDAIARFKIKLEKAP